MANNSGTAPPRKKLNINAFDPEKTSDNKVVYKKIPLGELSHNPINDELYGDEVELVKEEIDEMVMKITANGLLQPLVVRRHPNQTGRYQIISGHTRYEALKKLGRKDVECKIIKVETALDQLLSETAVIATNQNKKQTTLRKAKEVKRLEELAIDLKGLGVDITSTNEYISMLIGVGRRQVIRLKNIAAAPKEVKEKIAGGSLTIKEAEQLVPKNETQKKQSETAKEKAAKKKAAVLKEIDFQKLAIKIYTLSADIENAKNEGKELDAKTIGIVKDSINKLQSIVGN